MCGIFAFIGNAYDEQQLFGPINRIAHRGPDSHVVQTVAPGVVFGFHRLAINGLNNVSNQPLQLGTGDNSVFLVCNGEIYNSDELKQRYRVNEITESDCEIILHLYNLFGSNIERLVQELDGVYAFVLYDKKLNRCFAANDSIGVRPLYQMRFKGNDDDGQTNVAFASEPCALDPIARQVYDKECAISFFAPGSTWTINCDSREERVTHTNKIRYSIAPDLQRVNQMEQAQRDTLIDSVADRVALLLDKAVQKRVDMCERPICALLSGGLDSSTIAAMLAKNLPARADLHLFTISIVGKEDAPDLRYAKLVVEFLRKKYAQRPIEHHVVVLSEQDFIDAIPDVVRAIQSYDITTVRASLGNFLVAKYIKENSDRIVVFNGDVSEEQFGSYRYFEYAESEEAFREENERLLDTVHCYDVLRSARCVESQSLEARTPFADKHLLKYTMSIPAVLKMFYSASAAAAAASAAAAAAGANSSDAGANSSDAGANSSDAGAIFGTQRRKTHAFVPGRGFPIEKYLLRVGVEKLDLLPSEVLWRPKEAFSDGVSNEKRSLHQILAEYSAREFDADDVACAQHTYAHCTPKTSEALLYREYFHINLSRACERLVPEFWMPRFVECGGDPSARVLANYKA